MNKPTARTMAMAMAGLSCWLAPAAARAQILQSSPINPQTLDSTESVRGGSLSARRPGRLIAAAAERHRAWQGRALRGPHGTPLDQQPQEPGFYVTVLDGVLQAFFNALSTFIFGLQAAGGLGGALGSLPGG